MKTLRSNDGTLFSPVPSRMLKRLATLAYPEQWSWEGDEFGMLDRYLGITLERALEQGRVTYCRDGQGDMAIVATGLVDSTFEDVYYVCEPETESGDEDVSEWTAKAFCTLGRARYGRRIARIKPLELPESATYVERPMDLVMEAERPIEVDFDALVSQYHKIDQEVVEAISGGDVKSIGNALLLSLEVAKARLRHMPLSAIPAWGPAVGLNGLVFCLPLCLVDTQRCDVVLALVPPDSPQDKEAPYIGEALLSLAEAALAARVVCMANGGMGWLYAKNADAVSSGDSKRATEIDVSKTSARLTCRGSNMPPYVVHSGDTVGVLRRQTGDKPSIVFPKTHGFEGVSQVQGKFVAHSDGHWEFVHEGSNWTLVRHSQGTQAVLRTRGANEALSFGDSIVFSGSPAFVFGR